MDDEVVRQIAGDSIGKKSRSVLLNLVSRPGIVHRSLALLIAILLLSESVAATPRRMGVSIAQQPTATEQDATRAAAKRAFEEGEQLRKQGTAESLERAITKYEEALPLYRAIGDSQSEAVTLNNIGYIYSALGDKQKALDFYNQSLPLRRATGDKAGEAIILNNIGLVYDDLGQKQKALDYYNQSLPLSRATGEKAGEAATLNNIGLVYDDLGQKQKALDYYNQSLPLRRATGDKAGEATTLNNIGAVYSALGEKQEALEYYNQSLPLSRATGNKAGEALTHYNFAYLERNRGNINVALTQIEAAITIIEDLRTKIGSQELRASYFATVQNYYQFYIDLLMQLHKTNPNKGYDALALHASERARARSLLELLTEANANIRQGVNPELLQQERTLQQQLSAAEYNREQLLKGQYTDKQLNEIKQQIATLLTQLQQLEGQIRVNSPRYAALKYPQPLNLPQIQQQVLDDNTILLEYSLGEERSYLWAVTKTSITSYELPKRADIETAAQEFYQQLKSEAGNIEEGMKLSQMILAPVMNQLGNKRLLIVGDGALQSIPFAALPIPRLGNSDTCRGDTCVAPTPMLVVLSACETGLGKDVKGEGLVGLTRGFMYAGAKSVTVSLWSVNDTATSLLMTKYYQQMLDKGVNPVAALRAAQLEMMKTDQWKAPYYWAAFLVQGEWR